MSSLLIIFGDNDIEGSRLLLSLLLMLGARCGGPREGASFFRRCADREDDLVRGGILSFA